MNRIVNGPPDPPHTRIAIPDLAEKIHLLLALGAEPGRFAGEAKPRRFAGGQQRLADLLEVSQDQLSRQINGARATQHLPNAGPHLQLGLIPRFLRLFGLRHVPDTLSPGDRWIELVRAPLPEFMSGVAKLGGRTLQLEHWDQFHCDHAEAMHAAPDQGRSTFWIEAAPREAWRRREAGQQRLWLPGLAAADDGPDPVAAPALPSVRIGDEACVRLRPGRAFEALHLPMLSLFLFQDLRDTTLDRRIFLRLMPRPDGEAFQNLPERHRLARHAYGNEDELLLPEKGCFEIRPDHAGASLYAVRRVLALFTELPLDPDVIGPALDWEIPADCLHHLATRLGGERSRYGKFLLWSYTYGVEDPSEPPRDRGAGAGDAQVC